MTVLNSGGGGPVIAPDGTVPAALNAAAGKDAGPPEPHLDPQALAALKAQMSKKPGSKTATPAAASASAGTSAPTPASTSTAAAASTVGPDSTQSIPSAQASPESDSVPLPDRKPQ